MSTYALPPQNDPKESTGEIPSKLNVRSKERGHLTIPGHSWICRQLQVCGTGSLLLWNLGNIWSTKLRQGRSICQLHPKFSCYLTTLHKPRAIVSCGLEEGRERNQRSQSPTLCQALTGLPPWPSQKPYKVGILIPSKDEGTATQKVLPKITETPTGRARIWTQACVNSNLIFF